jgi:hypothetical protein
MKHSLALAIAVSFASGCAQLAVGPANPRPNVMMAAGSAPAELRLDESVRDEYVIPGNGSIGEVPVTGWRNTLTRGFRNAFTASEASGPKLQLINADLSFSPAAVSGAGTTVAVTATIRFRARLVDASGAELGALAGTVHAREATASATPQGMTDNAAKAVEALYEELAAKLVPAQSAFR